MLHIYTLYIYIYRERERSSKTELHARGNDDFLAQPAMCETRLVADRWGQHYWGRCKSNGL